MPPDRSPSRVALLDAGLDLLGELTPADLVTAIRTRAIAARAGLSPPSFFHHFGSVEDYAAALVDHAFRVPAGALTTVVTDALTEVQRIALPAEQSIAYHARDLHQTRADPASRIRTGLWALGGPAVDDAFARFEAEVQRQLLPQVDALHRMWGRQVRPPLDTRSYLALQLALLTGAGISSTLDPDVVTVDRYARAAAAFSMVMLRPVGDRRTMDDRLSEMNWLPAATGTASPPTHRRAATRARILAAARDLFGEYGYTSTSITQLARGARVHVATLYDHFASKDHIALALLEEHASEDLTTSPLASGDPHSALRDHLEAIARFADTYTGLARIYLAALACGDRPTQHHDTIHATTHARAIQLAAAGAPDPGRVTDNLLVTTIGTMLRHPGDGPAHAARTALTLLQNEDSTGSGPR